MKKLVIILLAIIVLFPLNTFAGGWGSNITTVTGFYAWSNSNAYFRVANMENPDGCSNPLYLALDVNSINFKINYSTLMDAYASGSTVQLSYNGCTTGGYYPIINAIAVPHIW